MGTVPRRTVPKRPLIKANRYVLVMKANSMSKHWYLVAHRAGARIFEQEGIKPELKVVRRFENPDGALKTSELVTDRQGRSDSSDTVGHNAVGQVDTARQHVLETFAREVSSYLEQEAKLDTFKSLVLIAGPQVLGELKKLLGDATSRRLGEALAKDLVRTTDHDMAAALKDAEVLCLREVL
jgi:protein required for attachment to host cells